MLTCEVFIIFIRFIIKKKGFVMLEFWTEPSVPTKLEKLLDMPKQLLAQFAREVQFEHSINLFI